MREHELSYKIEEIKISLAFVAAFWIHLFLDISQQQKNQRKTALLRIPQQEFLSLRNVWSASDSYKNIFCFLDFINPLPTSKADLLQNYNI